jgi:MFS family permease
LATATARGTAGAGTAPRQASLVLLALIVVAAVANLNLTVANVALPDIGRAFDTGQTALDLIAIGYSLGLAGSVLYLGAVGDRYGRRMMLVLGVLLSVPACLMAAYAPDAGVLVAARLLGGVSAGMAYPTTLALITALWSGPARIRAIALWSGLGGAITALGPLLAGLVLQHFWWGSAFLLTLPLAVVALILALACVPSHVNESSDPVDHPGGVLSMVFVAALVITINFAPVPGAGTLALGTALVALAAGAGFFLRQRRAREPLYDLHVAGRRIFWVAAVGGIIVFGSLMGSIFVGQQYLQDVLGYSPLGAGLAILPAAVGMVAFAPLSARLTHARGSGFTLLGGYLFCLLSFVTMLLGWKQGSSYWVVGLAFAFLGAGVGLAGTPASHSLTSSVPTRRAGMAPAPPTCSATWAARSCSRSWARCSRPATPGPSPGRWPARRTAARSPAACRTSSRSRSPGRRRSRSATRSTPGRSPRRPGARSWPATSGPIRPPSWASCSVPRSCSSCSRAATPRRRCWRGTTLKTGRQTLRPVLPRPGASRPVPL